MVPDLRQAYRRIRQQPTFALTILIVLILVSSALALVLAVADAVILRPFTYREPERLTVIWEIGTEHQNVIEVSHRNYVDWRAQANAFEELAAFGSVNWSQRLTGRGEPAEIPAAAVSASFFDVLGVPAHLGRVFRESDDQPNSAPVAVITHGLWQRFFGADTQVVGERLTLDGKSFEIVGVMPRGFDFPAGAELWIPIAPPIHAASAAIKTDALEARWFGVLFALGRLKPNMTPGQAREELDAISADIDRDTGSRERRAVVLTPFEERLLGNTQLALLLLMAAVSLIVLTACANVTTLLLMRASRIQAETALRLLLGATGRQIFQLWLAETLALFVTGAVAGLFLASLMLPLVIRLAPDSVYRIGDSQLSAPILFVVVAIMGLAAIGTAALITALTVWQSRLARPVRDRGSTATSSRMRGVRRVLVTTEVTVSCVLLIGAGLTLRSFLNLRALDLGFVPDGVLTFVASPSSEREAGANRQFYAPLLEHLNALPDVVEAGAVFLRPLAFEAIGTDTRLLPEGFAVDDTSMWLRFAVPVNKETITPAYFKTMQIPLRDGRHFSEADNETALPVAIISESTARRLFPGERAVGRRIVAGEERAAQNGNVRWRTIVGVIGDVRYRGLQDPRFDYYVPYGQIPDRVQHLVVRTRGNPLQLIARVKREARQLDPFAVIEGVMTMDQVVDRAIAPWRLNMVLFAVLGILALVIASVGVYGVAQYAVVERWHELGIRAALGASAHQLTRLIVLEGSILAVGGITLGIVAAWPVAYSMSTLLFGVTPIDATTFAVVVASLAALVGVASYIPARLAGRAEPSLLLRSR